MDGSYTLSVGPDNKGLRLDKFLATHLPDLSRTRIAELIESGHVTLNDVPHTTSSAKVREGQTIHLTVPPPINAYPMAQDIPLNIVYEDEDVIVINKPAGLVVHPAPGNYTGTLVNALLYHCGERLSGINGVKRPGIVHRLDKETSGLLVVAKNDQAHHALADQLVTRNMSRIYQTLVWGRLLPKQGVIEGEIGRDPKDRKRMALRTGGKFARTHYTVLDLFDSVASLVECQLDTGRTHQIRVHLTAKGHPLIGDKVYGKPPPQIPPALAAYLEEKWPKGRQALHAKTLSFLHPKTHERLSFTTELPQDMQDLTQELGKIYGASDGN